MIDLNKERKEKQLQGITKMRNWFFWVCSYTEFNLQWSNEDAHLFHIETANILKYLDTILINGKWGDSDREILNGMRDWYMMNRGITHVRGLKIKI